MTESRQHLRATFDQVARLYDRVRPGYPAALFDDIVAFSNIPPGGRILEIGCGTGQATLPFARRGYRIRCVELGAQLAAVARDKLADYPGVEVDIGSFEDWPLEAAAFDLAISATAFHWIDPAIGYPKVASALADGGTIALFWNEHVHSPADQNFFETAHAIYDRVAPGFNDPNTPIPYPDEVTKPVKEEIERTGLFGPVTVRRYLWGITYDTAGYIDVLNTYSNHLKLEPERRERLFRGITELIDAQFGGQVTKGYLTILYLAQLRKKGE